MKKQSQKHKPAGRKHTALKQLCNLIPGHMVTNLAKKHGVDARSRTYTPWSHVVSPSRNNLSHANQVRDANMAEELYWSMMTHLMNTGPGFAKSKVRSGYLRHFSKAIHALDSTTIQLVANSIEVFFKEIKQTLQLSDFLGYSANAVRWQIWTGLLVHLLMRCLKFMHNWGHSFKRLFTVVRSSLWRRWNLPALLDMGQPNHPVAFEGHRNRRICRGSSKCCGTATCLNRGIIITLQ